MKPSILFIVPAEYEALRVKSVEHMILERDEKGFFNKVITVHPVCSKTRSIILNDSHEVYEIGLDMIPGSEKVRLLKFYQFLLWKVSMIFNARLYIPLQIWMEISLPIASNG